MRLRNILEAVLMAAGRPLDERALELLLTERASPPPDRKQLCAALQSLRDEYAERGVVLSRVAGGYRFQVRVDYAPWVRRLEHVRPPRYSRAVLETLCIIAYQQPITRGEIERIRGVSESTGVLRTLFDRFWIRVVGHREVPGRPELLATTHEFLDYFNLCSLKELPDLPDAPELPEALKPPWPEQGAVQVKEGAGDGAEEEDDEAVAEAIEKPAETDVAEEGLTPVVAPGTLNSDLPLGAAQNWRAK